MNNKIIKRIISILMPVLIVICIIIAIKYGIFSTGNKENNNKNSVDMTKHNSDIDNGKIQIDTSQIYSAGEPVEVRFYFAKGSDKIMEEDLITVTDYSYSRKLDQKLEFKSSLKENYGDIFDNDGTILKDYYYLYVSYNVKNIGDKAISYLPSNNSFVEVSKDGVANYNYYENNYYVYRPDTEELFGNHGILNDFKVNQTINFELVYLVSENAVNNNDICIFPNDGQTGISSLTKKENRFIFLDLDGRER